MQARLKALLNNSLVKDVSKLLTGTVTGRLIALGALPLVTRLYQPADFALLAVYLALVSTIAVAACLRLEIAIPFAETDDDAAQLLALAFLMSLGIGAIAMITILIWGAEVAAAVGKPALAPYLWLVPLGIIMAACYSALQFWATRARRFGSIARTRITQAAMGAGTTLGLGWLGITPLGLLIGQMLNIGAGGLRLGIEALRRDGPRLRGISWQGMRHQLSANRRYPLYSTPESLANVAGVQVPVLLIAAYGGVEAGFLFLAMQVMAAPMALLGSSISQVYISRAPEELRNGTLALFTLGIMRRLVQIGVVPLIFAGLLAPTVFPWIFGAEWARAGEIVSWLVPWMALQFIASPVSMVMYVTGRQRAMLVLTLAGFALRVGGVLIARAAFPEHLIIGLVFGSIAYYICVGASVCHAAGFSAVQYPKLLAAFTHWSIPAWMISGVFLIWIATV
jgi:O-antigen/teichoic acid export membrane protein